jgi:hypothetical protein
VWLCVCVFVCVFVCLFVCLIASFFLRLGPAAVGCGVRLYRAADGRLDRPAVWPRWAPPNPRPHLHPDWPQPCLICSGTGLPPTTGAPGPRRIFTVTGLTPATSAPGLGSPLPHLRRDWAHPLTTSAPGLGLPPTTSAPGLGSLLIPATSARTGLAPGRTRIACLDPFATGTGWAHPGTAASANRLGAPIASTQQCPRPPSPRLPSLRE